MKTDIYNQNGKKSGSFELPKDIFNLPWNDALVHQVVVSMQANQRASIAHAKGRGEVRGGGKKPWPQKGTGRARHGSTRSPIWVGGGVTHGPLKEKNYAKKINKKMKKKSLYTALSQKLRDAEILFLDKIVITQPKTKEAFGVIKNISSIKNFEKLAIKKRNRAIVIIPKKSASGGEEINRSFRNLLGVKISEARNLNILDLLKHKFLIIANPKESLAACK